MGYAARKLRDQPTGIDALRIAACNLPRAAAPAFSLFPRLSPACRKCHMCLIVYNRHRMKPTLHPTGITMQDL